MNKTSTFLVLFLSIMSVFLSNGCKKEYVPKLKTAQIQNVTYTTVQSGGEITDDGGAAITGKGVCWSTTTKPTISNNFTSDGTGATSFTTDITGLDPGTNYYIRAYARNSSGVGYGNEYSFQTTPLSVPDVTTADVTGISIKTANSGGNVTSDGGSTIISRGLCWSTHENPTTADSITVTGSGTGAFTGIMSNLTAGTTYYVRAYATNSTGTAYGNQLSFSTNQAAIPALTTAGISEITRNSAISGGNVTDDGGADVTARGVCWSTSQNPVVSGSKTSDGTGKGQYISNMPNLTPGTTYYVRAYATNSSGTAYGNQVVFSTNQAAIPALTTADISEITRNSAISGGNVTDDGGADVTARGVCWNTSQNPVITDSKTTDGTGKGQFISNMPNLTPGTTYYVRAYATNSSGTAYGNEVTFSTTPVVFAVLTTREISGVTASSAITGGNITNDGGGAITSKGVCWSTSESPTLENNFTTDGTGASVFTSNIESLNNGTVYYIRAYATNSAGTAYGNQLVFITSVADADGNLYKTVKIGNQVWMSENLRTTKMNDNSSIPQVTASADWITQTTPAYSLYNNNDANKDIYGVLYNWFAAAATNLCPTGWHVSTDHDYNILEMQLGLPADSVDKWGFRGTDQATQMKGTTTWNAGGNGTNSSGFNALAGGYRQWSGGNFTGVGLITYFWTSTDDSANGHPTVGWYRRIDNTDTRVYKATTEKEGGKYVRCVKD